MNGSIVNFIAIVAGAAIGLLLRVGIPEKTKETVLQAMGLVVVLIGIKMALASQNALVVVVAMASGSIIGELLDLEGRLDRFGSWLTVTVGDRYGDAGRGFVMATLVFCIGAMAIVGSIEEGLRGNPAILYAKSLIDGVCATVFAASLGIGVMLSAISVLLYQGSMTLLASGLENIVSEVMLSEISGTGGLLILAIGLNMLQITKLKLANFLPSLFMAAVIVYINVL